MKRPLGLIGVLGALLLVSGCFPTPSQPPKVILYGDSLSVESYGYFAAAIAAHGIAEPVDRAWPGIGICDLFDEMEADKETILPTAVVLEFAGNHLPQCVQDSGMPTLEKYRADAQQAIDLWKARGVHVFLVATPPKVTGVGTPESPDANRELYYGLALQNGVGFLDAGHSVISPGSRLYQFHMPCLPDETPEEGCGAGGLTGLIQVRDSKDGLHFCPPGTRPLPCAGYVAGARRFGEAMAQPVVDQLGF